MPTSRTRKQRTIKQRTIKRKTKQARRLIHESLEGRYLLAFDGLQSLFSTTGNVDAGAQSDVALRFTGGEDTAVLGFLVTSTNGLDPAAATISQDGNSVSALRSLHDVDTSQSLTVAHLPVGGETDYQFGVTGENGTAGGYQLDVILMGDQNGDGVISDLEMLATTAAVTQYLGTGNAVTDEFYWTKGINFSQDQHREEMDSDLDGKIDGFDLTQVEINYGKAAISAEVADGIRLVESFTFQDDNNNGRPDVGETITFTNTVTNTGSTQLTNVTVSDDINGTLTLTDGGGNGPDVLDPGESETTTSTRVITATDQTNGTVTPNPEVTANTPSGPTLTTGSSGNPTPIVIISPSIQVSKTFTLGDENNNGRGDTGETIVYQYTVTNNGNDPLSSVQLTDDIEGTLTLTDNGGDGVGVIAAGAVETASSTHTITAAEFAAGSLTNIATVVGTPTQGTVVSGTDTQTVTFLFSSLTVDKTATVSLDANNNGRVDAGDQVTYGYTVTNNGNVSLSSITLVDDVEGTLALGVTTLAPNVSTTASSVHTVTAAEIAAGSLTNIATANGTPSEGPVATATDTVTLQFPQPSISTTKTATLTNDVNQNGRADVGDQVTYAFQVTNDGNDTLTGVTLTDDIEGVVTIGDTAGDGVGVLAPGASESGTAVHTVTAAEFAAGSLTNTATAVGTPSQGTNVSDTASATVNFQSATITVDKTSAVTLDVNNNGRLDPNDQITYSYTVTNTGDVALTSITLVDDIEGTLALNTTTLNPTETATATSVHTVTATEFSSGALTNIATATGTPPSGSDATGTDTLTVNFINPSIAVTSTVTLTTDVNQNGRADVGDQLTYAYQVTNSGDSALSAVSATDSFGAVTLSDTTIAPSASVTGSQTHTVTLAEFNASPLVNTVNVTGTPTVGTAVVNQTSASTNFTSPSIAVVKTFALTTDNNSNGRADAGDVLTNTYTITNSGDTSLTGITLTDTLVASAITVPGGTLASGASQMVTATTTITAADVTAGSLSGTTTVTGTPPEGNDVTSTANTSINLSAPSISVAQAVTLTNDVNGNSQIDVGDTITFTHQVTNNGGVALSDVTVNDGRAGTLVLSDNAGDGAGNLAVAAPAETASATYVVLASDLATGSIVNTVNVSGNPGSGTAVTDSNTLTVPLGVPSISVVKTQQLTDANANNRADLGETITYTYTVTNNGNVTLNGVGVTDDVLGTVTLVDDAAGDGPSVLTAGAVQVGTIAHVITQSDINSGTLSNTATATGTNGDRTVTDTSTVNVNLCAGHRVDQSIVLLDSAGAPTSGPITAGQQFQLQFHFEDQAPVLATTAVLAGYVDIMFTSGLITIDSITYSDEFPNFRQGTIDNAAGTVTDAGASDGTRINPAQGTLVFTLNATANNAGTVNFTTQSTQNALLLQSVGVFGQDGSFNDQTCYRGIDVVVGSAVTSAAAAEQIMDTDGNGRVSPADALMLINALDAQASGAAGEIAREVADVNRDGRFSPADALVIIDHISDRNQRARAESVSAVLPPANADAIFSAIGDDDSDENVDEEIGLLF